MKKLLLTALTISMLAFVGCSSDNDNDNPTSTKKIKLVSNVVVKQNNIQVGSCDYTYDNQNRLTKFDSRGRTNVFDENDDYSYTITYTGNTIKLIEIDNVEATTYAETNNNGYVLSINENDVTPNIYYTYDANGYLTKLEETYVGTYNITWANGNIVKIQGDANADDQGVYEYEYTNIENKMNINMFEYSCSFEWLCAETLPFFPYGKPCKNLISKVNGSVREFQYTMTSDGYISKMTDKLNGEQIEILEFNFSYIEVDAK